MSRTFRAIVPAALGLTLVVGAWGVGDEPNDPPPSPAPPAQQPKGAGEVIGETVDGVVQSIKRGARATTETLQEQYQRARTSVHNMGVQARVYSRLHWDKALNDAKVEVEVKGGTAILRGTVKDTLAKARANELARETVGVDRVDDHLTIEPAPPVEGTPPAAKTRP